MKESDLRDQLKINLSLIEDGLELVDDEFYLKNKIGTNGFVDILARDQKGRLVVIEIKISKHSERDAITELFKYIALLKQNMALKDSEIRLFVISTDWRELLVPFTEFHKNTAYTTCGLHVEIDDNAFPISIDHIVLPNLSVGRKLIPRHWIQVYRNEVERNQNAIEYAKRIVERGINNFIIAHFYFDYCGFRQFGFYFAQQEESIDFYKEILSLVSSERFEEISLYTSEFSNDEDVLNEFADAAIDMIDVDADELEIGHPEKIKGYLQQDKWKIDHIARYGTFSSDIRLTDSQIIDDLCGFTGASHTWYMATIQRNDSAHLEEVIQRYGNCLYHNDYWRRSIRDYIDYFKSKDEKTTMHLSIFNTENILETLFLLKKYPDVSCVPNFKLIIDDPTNNKIEVFEGVISSTSLPFEGLDTITENYFRGDAFNIILYTHLHAISEINSNIMNSLSLFYNIRYRVITKNEPSDWSDGPLVRGKRITTNDPKSLDFYEWVSINKSIVNNIYSIYNQFTFNVIEYMK